MVASWACEVTEKGSDFHRSVIVASMHSVSLKSNKIKCDSYNSPNCCHKEVRTT